MAQHAFLSPSASHRWLHCTMSPSLEGEIEDKGSIYAEEGTLAHAICEAKLKGYLTGAYPEAVYFNENGCNWWEERLWSDEMQETTDYYRDVVIRLYEDALKTTPDAKLLIEQKVKVSDKLFGTADALIIADGLCHVIDYKHGKGVEVSAENNPQMMIYALGAHLRFCDDYDMEELTMTIVQPRLYNTSSFNIPVTELTKWGMEVLIPTATKIIKGKDLAQEAGVWCRFCKVKGQCKALATLATETTEENNNPALITLGELAELLPKVDVIKQWCEEVSNLALQKALDGKEITGYKIVEGRSIRKITDPGSLATKMIEAGISEDAIFKPKEVNTLTVLEKTIGKKRFAEDYGEFVEKPKGKPTLVPLSDKRPVYNAGIENDFGDINTKDI